MNKRTEVFISYSHADKKYYERLLVHLKPFEKQSLLSIWSDQKIKDGARWREEIQAALDRAAVAILLVSPDFLASDFIADNELPPLLEAAAKEGVRIYPVIIKPCVFESIADLSEFQAINPPSKPVIAMHAAYREKLWANLALSVTKELKSKSPAVVSQRHVESPAFFIVDEILNPSIIKDYYAYAYQYVDYFGFMPLARKTLRDVSNVDKVIKEVENRFRVAGWTGGGDIRIIWLPPFVFDRDNGSSGHIVWYVKQRDNETSWIISPIPLPFGLLTSDSEGL